MKLPFHSFEPTFFAGLLDDPLLWLRVRPWGRSLLVDCGQLQHLAKRVVRSLDAVFVSHAHMDHFMGMDCLVRQVHVAPRPLAVFGPPGLAERLAHKLAGYDWNLCEEHWCTLRLTEVHPDRLEHFEYRGAKGFACQRLGSSPRDDAVIYANRYLQVEAALCDHRLPVLALRLAERPSFAVDRERLAAAGLAPGSWLQELKGLFSRGKLAGATLEVPRLGDEAPAATQIDAADLYRIIAARREPASIGYLTDVGFTEENRVVARRLLSGVTLLVCECAFLAAEREKARASWHLCSTDLNRLLADLQPQYVLPMHLSKGYLRRTGQLYDELQPPTGTTVLRLPDHVAPRPLLPWEVPQPGENR